MSPSEPGTEKQLRRVILLMSLAAFASGFSLRISDPLLPQLAVGFGVTIGSASAIVTAYAIPYGLSQAFTGVFGDRFGKCQWVTMVCLASTALVLLCAASQSITQLTLARLICAPGAASIVPLGIAFVGDTVPYERRQTVLARFLAGQMIGMIAGQVAGGIIGDHFGWRMTFYVLAGVFALAGGALLTQLRTNPWTAPTRRTHGATGGFLSDYRKLLFGSWPRFVILAVFFEGAIFFGGFTYVAAFLHLHFDLSFTLIGLAVAGFGLGCVLYVVSVQRLVRLGERGLVIAGGAVVMFGFLILAIAPVWELAPFACAVLGFGYYMVHNTLQTHATQMLPEARGTAVAGFSSALYLGQSIGVALAAPVIDRAGAVPVFVGAAALWPLLAIWMNWRLRRHVKD